MDYNHTHQTAYMGKSIDPAGFRPPPHPPPPRLALPRASPQPQPRLACLEYPHAPLPMSPVRGRSRPPGLTLDPFSIATNVISGEQAVESHRPFPGSCDEDLMFEMSPDDRAFHPPSPWTFRFRDPALSFQPSILPQRPSYTSLQMYPVREESAHDRVKQWQAEQSALNLRLHLDSESPPGENALMDDPLQHTLVSSPVSVATSLRPGPIIHAPPTQATTFVHARGHWYSEPLQAIRSDDLDPFHHSQMLTSSVISSPPIPIPSKDKQIN